VTDIDNVVQIGPHRRRKQERRVMDNIGLTPAERAEAQVFISPKEMDELILRGEISDTKLADDDKFPTHPWTGD
jgi:hypothetical protein